MASQTHRSSEHSLSNEPQNSITLKRILLPLEPDFSAMSAASVIISPPSNTWQSTDRHTSQTRLSRRDQPKTKHKSKKRRRHRLSSSSSSSRSSSLSSSSSSIQSMNDYGRYKRTRQSPQTQVLLNLRLVIESDLNQSCQN